LDRADAWRFAQDWVKAWNDRNIDDILSHYAEDVVFHSPRIALVMGTDQTSVEGKPALRAYWSKALASATELYFDLDTVLVGSDALTLLYTNHRDQSVAETFVFNADGEVTRAVAAYA
jgi:hypothetical protein